MESSDEEEGEQEQLQKKKRVSKPSSQHSSAGMTRGQAWIREGGEDEPLNFLDPSVTQRVSGEA